MPVATYEGMFLLDSSKAATAWDDKVKHVHDILTKHESEIVASRQWDERRLAYTVDGHKKGTYLLTYFKTDGSHLNEIVADCRLSDLILRELVLKVHPKLADHLVNQAMTSTPNVDAEVGHRRGRDDRSPRRRRLRRPRLTNNARWQPARGGPGFRSGPGPQGPSPAHFAIFTLVDAAANVLGSSYGEQPSSKYATRARVITGVSRPGSGSDGPTRGAGPGARTTARGRCEGRGGRDDGRLEQGLSDGSPDVRP